jgi:hypothetical protein
VEGAGGDPAGAERAQTGAQLARRAAREREGHHLVRGVHTGRDPVRDAVGDRAGLAGAGAGEHADRPEQRFGGAALLVVERGEQILGRGHRGPVSLARRRSVRRAIRR